MTARWPCRALLLGLAAVACLPGHAFGALPRPFAGIYIHVSRVVRHCETSDDRERALGDMLDRIRELGIDVAMPYVTTTSGRAVYRSRIVPSQVFPDWDPLASVMRLARARGLLVYPVVCTLACGHDRPAGILVRHPEWALRGRDGRRIGHISPAHPAAREWVVSVLREIVDNYQPDGLLLDYMRFNNRPMQLDAESQARFDRLVHGLSRRERAAQWQQFKVDALTQLVERIHEQLRGNGRELPLAIYTWGPHVVSNHRIAQDWRLWARRGYIDMVNVSGYCYPENYGQQYLEEFEDRMRKAVAINRELGRPVDITLCLGIVTSHGSVSVAGDIATYLRVARAAGVEGVAIFNWPSLESFADVVRKRRYLWRFKEHVASEKADPPAETKE